MANVFKIVLTSPEGDIKEISVKEYVKIKSSEWIFLSTSNQVEYIGFNGEKLKTGRSIIELGKIKRQYLTNIGEKY